MERQLLSTYVIKILDNQQQVQTLSRFNGHNDFYEILRSFLDSIFTTIVRAGNVENNTFIHLTTDGLPRFDIENRRIYGFFSSGVSGERYTIKDIDTGELITTVLNNHGAFRNLFFYVVIPVQRDRAALILQRRSKFGIKTVFERALNNHFRGLGYQRYRIQIDSLLHGRVYRRMMDDGLLKKVEFVKRRLPRTLEEFLENNNAPLEIPGTLKTSLISPSGLPQVYKDYIDNLMVNADRERIEIQGMDEDFAELEFELQLNGKSKKFYVTNPSKAQPDIDVTADLVVENGQPTLASLIEQAQILVNDVINFNIEDAG